MSRAQFNMRIKPEFIRLIDDWRGEQRPIPSRTEAIVILCERAVADDRKYAKELIGNSLSENEPK